MFFPISHTPIIDKYRGEYTNVELVIDKRNRIFVMVQVNLPEKEVINRDPEDIKVIGKDRVIKNIAVLSNNVFFNSKHLREVKGRIQAFASPSDSAAVKQSLHLNETIPKNELESSRMVIA